VLALRCDQELETTDHLLVNCCFAKEIWWNSLSWMECSCTFSQHLSLQNWWEYARLLQPKARRKGFDTLFMLVVWLRWKERNGRLFNRQSHTVSEVLDFIKSEITLWVQAGAARLGCLKRE
jgi:hypothetical protein